MIAKRGTKSNLIEHHGIKVINLNINRGKINPLNDLVLLYKLIFILKRIMPDILHTVAIKPILYGNIAAVILKIPHCVSSFAGLGFLFISKSIKAKLIGHVIRILFRLILNRRNNSIIFQNNDDLNLMIDRKIVKQNLAIIIRGSGVDGKIFNYTKENNNTNIIVLASRMLWDKGIREFVGASAILKKIEPNLKFIIVGDIDQQNPSAIHKKHLLKWQNENLIEWWGHREDICDIYKKSNIVCLPSYREGLPKSLIEAAACGRAIITSDVPGCREIVIDGFNGILVPKKNTNSLANAILKLINNDILRNKMGLNGIKYFKKNFTIEHIVSKHIDLYMNLLQNNKLN